MSDKFKIKNYSQLLFSLSSAKAIQANFLRE
jgi:hypothetical protein